MVYNWRRKTPVLTVARVIWEDLDTPTSLGLFLCERYGDILSIVSHKVLPMSAFLEADSEEVWKNRQAVDLVRKYPFQGVTDTLSAAVNASQVSEARCSKANDRLLQVLDDPHGFSPRVLRIIDSAREKVSSVLGDFDANEWLDGCYFGPGVSCTSSRTNTYDKLGEELAVNPAAHGLLTAAIQSSPIWSSLRLNSTSSLVSSKGTSKIALVDSGRRAYVPKTALTDRPIEVQPSGSGYLQMGIGRMIRRRLKAVHCDLDHGWARNAELARVGSRVDGDDIATVDLESASDSICLSLVNWLVPSQWLFAMNSCRPRFLEDNGILVETERYSSMGNGYTFELESLLFWCICWAVIKDSGGSAKNLSVYGDDITIPVEHKDTLLEVFSFCGFQVNSSKTFWDYPFRESCGSNWYNGYDVTPLRFTEESETLADYFSDLNRLRKQSRFEKYFSRAWRKILSFIPTGVRFFGPPTDDSRGYIHAPFETWSQNVRTFRKPGQNDVWYSFRRISERCPSRDLIDPATGICFLLYRLDRSRKVSSSFHDDAFRYGYSSALKKWLKMNGQNNLSGHLTIPPVFLRLEIRLGEDLEIPHFWIFSS